MLKVHSALTKLRWRVVLVVSMFALTMTLVVGTQTTPAAANAWSFVRIFHASPDVGIVDVFMDGNKILSNFQYGTVTGYTPVAPGEHNLQIAAIGKGVNAAVLTQAITLQAGVPYTVVALGTKATGLSFQVFADNNQVAGNLAKVRVYHMSAGTGVVDVSEQGKTLINALPYKQASNYISLSPGSYTFNLSATQNDMSTAVAAQLRPWTVTSIFAIRALNNGSAGPQLQFVQSQITGMPGMPGTGSDPNAAPASAQSSWSPWPWSFLALAILVLCGASGIITCRARGKITWSR